MKRLSINLIVALSVAACALPLLAGKQPGISKTKNSIRGDATATTATGKAQTVRNVSLDVGEDAPDFTLQGLHGASVTLSSFKESRPVFLVFGSYT